MLKILGNYLLSIIEYMPLYNVFKFILLDKEEKEFVFYCESKSDYGYLYPLLKELLNI